MQTTCANFRRNRERRTRGEEKKREIDAENALIT